MPEEPESCSKESVSGAALGELGHVDDSRLTLTPNPVERPNSNESAPKAACGH